MPWRPRIDEIKLKRECDRLAFQLVRLREDLRVSERHRIGLEVMLDVRMERIDSLTVQIERLRAQNQKLDTECERSRAEPLHERRKNGRSDRNLP